MGNTLITFFILLFPLSLASQTAAVNDPPEWLLDAPPALSTVPIEPAIVNADDLAAPTDTGRLRGEFAVTPLPIVNPTVGNGIGFAGMYAHRLSASDKVSPPSIFGGGGFYTDNGSRGLAVATKLFLKEDRFRLTAGIGKVRLNYNFYGVGNPDGEKGNSLPISQSVLGFITEGQVRVVRRWFAGVRFQTVDSTVRLEFQRPELADKIPPIERNTRTAAIGLHIQRDGRDSVFYPRGGSQLDILGLMFNSAIGSDFGFESYELSFAKYHGFGEKTVLAYRASACAIGGKAPFFSLCSLGNSRDLRGYEYGRYSDRRMWTGQVEYRRQLPKRLGFVLFGGAGAVAHELGDFFSNTRPSAGGGLRFTLAKRTGINLRFDVAVGQDGPAWYVSMGEAF